MRQKVALVLAKMGQGQTALGTKMCLGLTALITKKGKIGQAA